MDIRKFIRILFKNSVFTYVFFGGCTTLVNLVIYYLLRFTLLNGDSDLFILIANMISISCSILFAYFTNSRFVFHSTADTFSRRFQEFIKFVTARLSTMVIEIGGVSLMNALGLDDYIGKLVIQFVVLVLNYIFSRFLVFKK